jgi:hypothetical protein
MKYIVVAVALFIPILGHAKWQFLDAVAVTKYRDRLYVYNDQPHFIDKRLKTILIWVRSTPSDPDADTKNDYNNTKTTLFKVKCQSPTEYAYASTTITSLDGKVLSSDDFRKIGMEYLFPTPDSIAESVVDVACKLLIQSK